jgi:hypothetical protein
MKGLISLLICLQLFSCCGCVKKDPVAIRIGSISITVKEFESAYEEGRFQYGIELSRKDFLDALIQRKLILKEAEKLGLDRDSQVIGSLQAFYEQLLLKLALARKINELQIPLKASDAEIRNYFEARKDGEFAGKDLATAREEVEMLLLREKQKQALQEWSDSLHKKTQIAIDYKLCGIQ